MLRSLTTRSQLVPTCEQIFWRNSKYHMNLNSCPAKFMPMMFTTRVFFIHRWLRKQKFSYVCSQLVPSSFLSHSQMTDEASISINLSGKACQGQTFQLIGFLGYKENVVLWIRALLDDIATDKAEMFECFITLCWEDLLSTNTPAY